MPRYANRNGTSGVNAYEASADRIQVTFSDGAVYEYTYESAGRENVERMKSLAAAGAGLNSYINTTPAVKRGYSRRIR